MRVLIIIPAYNEALNITRVVDNIIENYPQFDYIVVNDCSVDDTLKICQEKNYNYLSLCTNLGIGGAVQAGYQYAVSNGYDFAVQIDGDGQHNPVYIEKMVELAISNQADMVIGSRFLDCEGFQSSFFRRIGINWINGIIRMCCGFKATDATSGFRVSSDALNQYFASNYAQDYPEPEAIVAASLKSFKVIEYPVVMNERQGGVSSINWKRGVYYMVKVSLALVLLSISMKRDRK